MPESQWQGSRKNYKQEEASCYPSRTSSPLVYTLSTLLAVLLIASSVAGLLYGQRGFYESYPASLAGLLGQDAVKLAAGLPLLLVSMWLTRRGSTRDLLL